MWFSESNRISCRLRFFFLFSFSLFRGWYLRPPVKPVFRIRSQSTGYCAECAQLCGGGGACWPGEFTVESQCLDTGAINFLPVFHDCTHGVWTFLWRFWVLQGSGPPLCAIVKETEGECLHPRCFCFTFAIIYSQIALQGNVPFSYFTPPFLINEPSLQ